MLFSTKAEYGVRLMVELGRRAGSGPDAEPISLAAVAGAETLPLAYLEHLVAKLRDAGLVGSVRGAHGGYRLPRAGGGDSGRGGGGGPRGPNPPGGGFPPQRGGRGVGSPEARRGACG